MTADGSLRWIVGNLGNIPAVTMDYPTYQAEGWTMRRERGTRFTNDGTGHGMFVRTEQVDSSKLAPVDFRVFVEPQQGASYADQLAVAQAAESLGYSAFFRSDHYLAMGGRRIARPDRFLGDAGRLARETTTIRLGTMVTSATFRHPGPLAISVAQVDEMSGGRVDFGIGAGWFEEEHAAYAIPFPPLGERFERLTEQLEILTGMWSTPWAEVRLHRHALLGRRLTCAPQTRTTAVPADRHRRLRRQEDTRRWQRVSPPSSTCRSWRST